MVLRPISAQEANALVRRVHYSGKVVNNSQIHIGAFLNGKLEGAMQFGPSLDKRKIMGLVSGTGWNEFVEINRMAFTDVLPRNSESRALSIAMKLLRKHAPHIKWVVTFADGAQCGDGTIYRAAGFVLTAIKPNNSIWEAPGGDTFSDHAMRNVDGHNVQFAKAPALLRSGGARFSRTSLTDNRSHKEQARADAVVRVSRTTVTKGKHTITDASLPKRPNENGANGGASMKAYIEAGFRPIPGYQLRYLYFIDPTARERLTVPILSFSEIDRRGAGMYRGEPRAGSVDGDTSTFHEEEGGSIPTPALHEAAD
jgi:hypothetical protein